MIRAYNLLLSYILRETTTDLADKENLSSCLTIFPIAFLFILIKEGFTRSSFLRGHKSHPLKFIKSGTCVIEIILATAWPNKII